MAVIVPFTAIATARPPPAWPGSIVPVISPGMKSESGSTSPEVGRLVDRGAGALAVVLARTWTRGRSAARWPTSSRVRADQVQRLRVPPAAASEPRRLAAHRGLRGGAPRRRGRTCSGRRSCSARCRPGGRSSRGSSARLPGAAASSPRRLAGTGTPASSRSVGSTSIVSTCLSTTRPPRAPGSFTISGTGARSCDVPRPHGSPLEPDAEADAVVGHDDDHERVAVQPRLVAAVP